MLKEELDKRGIGVCEFARMTGLDRTTVSRICYNRKRITMFTFRKIRDALGMSEEEAIEKLNCTVWEQNEHEWKERIYAKGFNIRDFCRLFDIPYDTVEQIIGGRVKPQRYTRDWVEGCINEL